MSALLKCALLIVTSVAYYRAMNPPNPAPRREALVNTGQILDWFPRALGYAWQVRALATFTQTSADRLQAFFVLTSLLHAAMLVLLEYPPSDAHDHAHTGVEILSRTCANTPSLARLASLTPGFLAGTSLVLAGWLLRMWCYRTMGAMFTWEVTVKQDHRLVTGGPYSYIRHPSYLGTLMLVAGTVLMHFGAGGYIQGCHVLRTPASWLVFVWVTCVVLGVVGMFGRMPVEDEALKQKFGETWKAYAGRVPYRLVPYIF